MRACVKTSKNSNVCISGISQLIELKFDMEVKPKCPFFSVISVAISGLRFYDVLNFLKNVCRL